MLQGDDKNGKKRDGSMSKKPIWITFTEKGVANRFDYGRWEEIEVHKNLIHHPKLYKAIMEHEFSHHSGNHTFADLVLDLYDGIKKPGLMKFIRENPGAWWQLSPIWFKNKKIIFDLSCLFIWVVCLTIGLIIGGVLASLI